MRGETGWQGWQLAGSIPEAYEEYLVPAIFVPWGNRLVELAGLRGGESVLDVACGTGIVARLAAAALGNAKQVIGLDLNPGMLAVAADNEAGIEWREGSAEDLPFEDGKFAALFCQFSLQFFQDRVKALAEFYRVLAPGGRFLLSLPCAIEHWPGANALATSLQQHVGGDAAAIIRAPFSLNDIGTLRGLIETAGFSEIEIEAVDQGLHFLSAEVFIQQQIAASPLAGPVSELDDTTRGALVADAALGMRDYEGSDGLMLNMRAHVCRAFKSIA